MKKNNSFHENNLRKDNSDDEKRDSLLNIDSSEKLKIGLRKFEKRVMCFA